MLSLRRAPGLVVDAPLLDEAQRAAATHRGRVLRVLGGPGTGKTTTAVEIIVARVSDGSVLPDQCVALTAGRRAAGLLREHVTARLGRTSTEPLARTHQSWGFGILRQDAALRGEPAPRLLSGPEQDVVLRDLLAGHASGEVPGPQWPERVQLALGTRGFRGELRDLLMRAVEHGLGPDDLAALGWARDRPEWVAGAEVLREYDQVTALSAPGGYDPAWILTAAADLLEDDDPARERVCSGLRLVVVDDAQEMTPAAVRLLGLVAGAGPEVVLLGDPDSAVQTFRGADPRFLASGWSSLGEGPTIVLPTAYRLSSAVHQAASRVAPKIGALGGAAQRATAPGRQGGQVAVHLLRAVSQEAAFIAAELRRAHLVDAVPWSDMAVVVRGQGRTATLRRVLAASGVPVSTVGGDQPVRDEVAVRPLLALMGAALGLARGTTEGVPVEVAVDALASPLGGADAVALRRLRRALRREELAGGGARTSDELLAEALVHPDRLSTLGPEAAAARRVARVVAAGRAAAVWEQTGQEGSGSADPGGGADRGRGDGRVSGGRGSGGRGSGSGRGRWAPGVTAETVLWAMWDACGLAGAWRATALDGGVAGARADRDLDAVVGLFDAAAKFVDRLPQLGPDAFLEHVRGQDVAGDTLVSRSPVGESVTVLTPQASAGRQWPLVVVAGVQEGVWPDLRLRGSLLGSEQLVDVVTGRTTSYRGAQAAVRYDETRLFLVAVTRSSHRLLVTAVRSDDEQPSVYLDLVDPLPDGADGQRPFTEVGRTMTLPSLVAQLRREVLEDDPGRRVRAVHGLARLVAEGVPGADPSTWWALREVSDGRDRRAGDAEVTVSPSKVEAYGACGFRWLLTACGGDGPSVGAASIGTLVHDIVAEVGDADAATLRAEVDARWGRLGLPSGWLSDRKRGEAHAMVERLARYFEEAAVAGWRRLGAEIDMRVALGRAVLSGRVDRLEADADGRLRVVDYKTGSSKPGKADLERHPQLGAYQVAVEAGAFGEHGARSAGAALLQVGKAANTTTTLQPQPPLAESDDPGWAEALVRETATGMAGSRFSATVGEWCKVCAVKTSCPVQPEGARLG